MSNSYYFIDGSALTAQVRQLRRAEMRFMTKKLCPLRFVGHLTETLDELHEGSYKRAIFYFPRGDEVAIEEFIRMPNHRRPGEVRDIHFKFCGHKLKRSAEFDKFVEESVPSKYQNRFSKSEKGIDIEMCCDALRLASRSGLDRLMLLTNDGDFIPLCRTLKDFGTNVSIVHLSAATPPNEDLLREADSYDIVDMDSLDTMFFDRENQGEDKAPAVQKADAEKPGANRFDKIDNSTTE